MTSPYTLDDFFSWKRQYMPARSIVIRAKIARMLVRLSSRIDRRPNVEYSIAHHQPKTWHDRDPG